MTTMYDRALMQLAQVDFCIGQIASDTKYLDLACFDMQQALEFLMKHILLEAGVKFDKTHNILYLLDLLYESGFTFDKEEELRSLATTITNWEEESRYGSGIRTTLTTLNRVKKIFNSMNSAFLLQQDKNNSSNHHENDCPREIGEFM